MLATRTALGLALGALVSALALGGAARSLADEPKAAPAIGAAAPAFKLDDADGKTVSLADFKGKVVVLEWANPSCPVWLRHFETKTLSSLAEKVRAKGVVWLAIDSTTKAHSNFASNETFRKANRLPYPMLLDPEGAVGHLYGAKTTPEVFVIDKEGKLAYEGAVDDDPRGHTDAAARKVYVAEAIDELLAGKAVTTAKTSPYGCPIKYKP
jgi:peroxiredoxin